MLYGIRTREQYRLAKAGYRVQTLIAYGDAWYPWYMRRLAERPANVAFAIRSMLPRAHATRRAHGVDRHRDRLRGRGRARALEATGRSVIHLEIGEPDFDTPANVREAAKQALDDGWTHYGPPLGLPRCARRSPRMPPPARASPPPRPRGRHAAPSRSCSTRSKRWSSRVSRSSSPTRASRSTSR